MNRITDETSGMGRCHFLAGAGPLVAGPQSCNLVSTMPPVGVSPPILGTDSGLTGAVHIIVEGVPVPYSERTTIWRGRVGSKRPPKLVAWQQTISRAAKSVMGNRPPLEGQVWMDMTFFMPIPKRMTKAELVLAEVEVLPHWKRPDRTSLLRAAEDALTGIAFVDDGQVAGGTPRKLYSPRPRVEITVEPWAGNPDPAT